MHDVEAQIEAIERAALIRPMPELGTVEVRGADRLSWLAGMVTQHVAELKPGEGRYALHVTKTGRLVAELWVAVLEDRVLLGLDHERRDEIVGVMDRFLIMEDAELTVPSEPHGWWLAHGPAADAVVAAARAHGAAAVLGSLGDLPTAIIAAPNEHVHNVGEALTQVHGSLLATPEGWERIRVERMLPRLGVDFDVDCYPQEASLEKLAVSFDKGCYIGQEAVFMLEKRGHVNKRLVRLVASDGAGIEPGQDVTTADGEKVGAVTSVARAGATTWALATVRYKQAANGTALLVGSGGQAVTVSSR